MRVHQLAKKLKVKSSDVIGKLALMKIEVFPSSKIDPLTTKMATLLVQQPVRVEEVAELLEIPVDKLLKKLTTMKIGVISHLSLLEEKELARLFKLKTFDKLLKKTVIKKTVEPKLTVLKLKPKQQRVFEVAAEMGVSEAALLKKLRQMNVLALHRRSPIDSELAEKLKVEKYTLYDKLMFRLVHFFEELPELLASSRQFITSTAFYSAAIVLLVFVVFFNVLAIRSQYLNQKLWTVKGEPISQSVETTQVLQTLALMRIERLGLKIPIVEEGRDQSPVISVLVHKNTSLKIGEKGLSILEDKQGEVSEKLVELKNNDIIIIGDVEGNIFYYRVIPEPKKLKPAKTQSNKVKAKGKVIKQKQVKKQPTDSSRSTIYINLTGGPKIVATLQKIE